MSQTIHADDCERKLFAKRFQMLKRSTAVTLISKIYSSENDKIIIADHDGDDDEDIFVVDDNFQLPTYYHQFNHEINRPIRRYQTIQSNCFILFILIHSLLNNAFIGKFASSIVFRKIFSLLKINTFGFFSDVVFLLIFLV